MGEYQQSMQVQAQVDEVFAYLSEVGNLPEYMPGMVDAHRTGGDQVEVTARVDTDQDDSTPKETVKGEAWLKVDHDARTMTWGSDGPNNYHGELSVNASNGGTDVMVTLTTVQVDGGDIDHDLKKMLGTVKQVMEGGRSDTATS